MSADEYGGLGKKSKECCETFSGANFIQFFHLKPLEAFQINGLYSHSTFFAKEESSKKIFWIGETFGNGVGGEPRRDNGRLPTNWKR